MVISSFSKYPVKAIMGQLPIATQYPSLVLENMKCLYLCVTGWWSCVLGDGGVSHLGLQSSGLTAYGELWIYGTGASRIMFLSPSNGQPRFLPMVTRRLG